MAPSGLPSGKQILVFIMVNSFHVTWYTHLNRKVPEPYLDEVFHIPQAQAYWKGRWDYWDDKITTPPGLYVWSYVFNAARYFTTSNKPAMLSVEDLRFSNLVLIHSLMLMLRGWLPVAGKPVNQNAALQRETVILSFPLLYFFSALYYTDMFSAWTVIATLVVWEMGRKCTGAAKYALQISHFVLGLVSLASRQTNIFWIAVFLGGLQAVETIQSGKPDGVANDPEVGDAYVEDIFHLALQLLSAAPTRLRSLLVRLWPQMLLLHAFTNFVYLNGGVVLGDKSNHVATIHLPQLLYIWPCMVFFSWPILLPQLTDIQRLRRQMPRLWLAALIMVVMVAIVHYNTIVHPFTLADNRHYVFYVFRILMRKWWIKYAAVPIYFVCACLVIGALNGGRKEPTGEDGIVRLSFFLVWFLSTALSLVTAPLVEPRYFIVPWLIWRMNVPELPDSVVDRESDEEEKSETRVKPVETTNFLERTVKSVAGYSLWIELAWYLVVNWTTTYMFLERGFEWKQEPGKIQRFMW